MLYTHAAVALVACAIGATGAWRVQGWRQAQIELDRLEQQREVETQKRQANQGVLDRDNEERARLAARAAAADRQSERLRDEIAYFAQRAASGPAVDESAAVAFELLGECRERRKEVGREAARLAAQVGALQDYAERVCVGGER
jgi:hypothetical protein